jgi:hypothetical protein
VAVVCAVTLLAIGFAHSVHHLNAPVSIIAVQVDTGTLEGSSDISQKATFALEHCFGCMTFIFANLVEQLLPHRVPLKLPLRLVDEARRCPPVVELRPPIAVI